MRDPKCNSEHHSWSTACFPVELPVSRVESPTPGHLTQESSALALQSFVLQEESCSETKAKIPNLLLRNTSNSGEWVQGPLPSSRAGTGSQTRNEALHEDSVEELRRTVTPFPAHREMVRSLLCLNQN